MSQTALPRTAAGGLSRHLVAFAAGFLAVLVFHQGVLVLLNLMGLLQANVYNMTPTAPLGVPAVLSASFWGGVWGILLMLILDRRHRDAKWWLIALVFGALGPTLVAWFVVAPIKGRPIAGGWNPATIWIGPLINGAWGVGTALLVRLSERVRGV
ncbi:MAG TPA: hypothetical protein VED40_22830 [Azospirillaceae bacterium]|nr:hypothetical protein [Azospirillaceae bacterium]